MKQHSNYFALYLLLLIVVLSGCTNGEATPSTKTIANISEDTLDNTIFPKDKIIDVKITIDEANFQAILDNPTAEQYYEASVDYNGNLLDNIGIRAKGNSSLSSVARMSDSDRYSFKLSFDEYVTQSIGGITKINLNNEYSDASYIREFMAYEIAEAMGMATPKYSFVNVYVNGELWGLYTAVEQMSTSFLEREFNSTVGTLYKSNGGNGADLTALDSFSDYTGLDVKSGNADGQALVTMTDVLNNGDAADYDQVLDVEAALRFIAFNTVTANMDSYAGNFKHNYYMYEQDGVFTVIPWDLNMAFGGFGGSGILIDEPTGVALATRPLIAKMIEDDTYREQYHHIIEDMINTYLADGKFESRVLELQALISDAVQNDPTAFVTFEQFEQGVQSLIEFVDTQVESINKQLSGEIASAGDGSGSVSSGPGGMGGGMGMGGFSGNRGNRGEANGEQGQMPNFEGGQMPNGGQGQMPNFEGGQMPNGGQGQMPNFEGGQMPNGGQGQMPGGEQDQAANAGQIQMPNGEQGQMPNFGDGQMPNGGQGQMPNGEQGQMPNFGDGQMPNFEDGQMPNFGDGQMPNGEQGQMPNFGDGQGWGGRGQGEFNGQAPFGNMNGTTVTVEQQQNHLNTTLISVALLVAGCLIIVLWRRKS